MEQMALLFFIHNLFVAQCREGFGVPVHHAKATINVAFAIEVYEHLNNALRTLLVHRKGCAVPVARGTQTAQLLQNNTTVLLGPCPGVLQKLLTREVVLLDALLG